MGDMFRGIGLLCLYGYVTGLILNIIDVSYTGKAIRLVVVLYIISNVITPLKTVELKIDTDIFPAENKVADESERYILTETAKKIEQIICSRLDEKNISYTTVDVHINEEEDGFNISDITIYGASTDIMNIKRFLNDIVSEDKIKSGG